MNVGDKVYLDGQYEAVILEIENVGKSFIYKIQILKDKWIGWCNSYELKLIGDDKMEIIKFNPTSYEYRDGIHYIDFDKEKLVWMTDEPGSLTWGNRSIVKIQMDNEGKIINRNHSYYFQLVDGTKRIFKLDYLIRNSDIEDRMIKYLVDSEDEYLFNVMKDDTREVIATDDDLPEELSNAYKEVENTINKAITFVKHVSNTKMTENELDELLFEIEQIAFARAINRALDEKDKEAFMKLTGGIE